MSKHVIIDYEAFRELEWDRWRVDSTLDIFRERRCYSREEIIGILGASTLQENGVDIVNDRYFSLANMICDILEVEGLKEKYPHVLPVRDIEDEGSR
jgi:hypothetical protein